MELLFQHSHWSIVVNLAMKNLSLILREYQTSTFLWIFLFLGNVYMHTVLAECPTFWLVGRYATAMIQRSAPPPLATMADDSVTSSGTCYSYLEWHIFSVIAQCFYTFLKFCLGQLLDSEKDLAAVYLDYLLFIYCNYNIIKQSSSCLYTQEIVNMIKNCIFVTHKRDSLFWN